nr:helix-turn-helix domain-containing protein [Enterococcus sp. 12C11_DIV0727]OTO68146.1 hypothetical protein A5866_000341 [Enterococcus sp. 12C11_DIV0727]
MERLIQNTMIRRVRLLDILIHSNQWTPMKELTKQMKCSQQTLLSDCSYFENEWPDYVIMEISKKRGIRVFMNKNHAVSELYKKMMKNSSDLALLESFFFYPNKDTSFHIKRLYISCLLYTSRCVKYISIQRLFRQIPLSVQVHPSRCV